MDFKKILNPKHYLGYRVENKVNELKNESQITNSEEVGIRKRCQQFLVCLFKQLKQILPESLEILKNLSIFSVTNILHPVII